MKIILLGFILLLSGYAPTLFAQDVATCTGGAGSDYGTMTCHVPDCDVTANVALGCTGVVPPAGPGDGYACYPTTGSAQTSVNKMCNSLTPPAADCFQANTTGMTDWCNVPSTGVNTPDENRVPLTDNADAESLSCNQLETNFVIQFCKVLTQ